MIEQDTVRLLRECDAGVKMGVSSIDEVQGYVKDKTLDEYLTRGRRDHEALGHELQTLLDRYRDGGKDPNPMAKGMSWVKTTMTMSWSPTDQSVAALITDGCNMGVKSLNKYLNQYQAADEKSKDITRRLIGLEERLADDISRFL